MTDKLQDAKQMYHYATMGEGTETREQAALCAIAAALIALVERLDNLTDEYGDGALRVTSSEF